MKIEQAITILKKYNKWRRGTPPYDEVGNRQPYSPKDIGLAIDRVVEELEGISGNQREIPSNLQGMSNDEAINILTHWADGLWMDEHGITNGDFDIAVSLACGALNPTDSCNSNKNLQELVWHKVTDGDLPKDRVFLAHCVGMGKGYVGRVCWNKRNGGFDNLNDIPPYASIKESHLDEYYDWWMEILELPKED